MCDRLIKYGLIFLIIYCPLAFGAVHIFSFTLMEIMVLGLVLCWLMNQILSRSRDGFSRDGFGPGSGGSGRERAAGKFALSIRKTPFNYFVLLFVGLVVIQFLPWPASWVKIISPGTLKIYKEAWGKVPDFVTLSINNYNLKIGLFKLLAYAGAFLLIINWADSREKIKALVIALILVGSIEAVYGILAYLGKYPYIWWYKKIWYLESLTGTYINRNHLAGLMELTVPIAFGLLVAMSSKSSKGQKEKEKNRRSGGIRGFLLSLNVDDHYQARKILLIFMIAIMILALLLSGSRGGILSLAAAFTIMSILLLSRSRLRKYAITGLVIVFLGVGYGLCAGLNTTIERFGNINNDAGVRMRYAGTSLDIVRDFPLLGTGWGTFIDAYRKYQTPKDQGIVLDHAHQDWIELGAETGLLGLGVVVFFFLFCLGYFFSLWRKKENSLSVGIGLGGMGAIVSLGLHSFTDFNVHIPANALLLSMVVGITFKALTYRRSRGGSRGREEGQVKVSPESMTVYLPAWLRWPLAVLMVIGFFYAAVLVRKPCLAEQILPTLPDSTIKVNKEPALEDVCKAIASEQGNAEYFYRLALLLEKEEAQKQDDPGEEDALKEDNWTEGNPVLAKTEGNPVLAKLISDEIKQGGTGKDLVSLALKRAVFLNPTNPYYHLKAGWHMIDIISKTDENLDNVETVLSRAEEEFSRAAYFMPKSAQINFSLGTYWLWKSKVVEDEKAYMDAFERFIQYFQAAYLLNRGYKTKIEKLVQKYYPLDDVLAMIFLT